MGKLLSWLAIAFAVYIAYKIVIALQRKSRLRESGHRDTASSEGSSPSSKVPKKQLTTLIACAHCGLQLPKDEALNEKGAFFCGEPHARLGVKPSGEA
jgi:uncharacterized protein